MKINNRNKIIAGMIFASICGWNFAGATKVDAAAPMTPAPIQAIIGTPERDLIDAVRIGDADRVRELLDSEVNTNIYDGMMFRRTPLHIAAEKGHIRIVSMLLDRGARADSLDVYVNTPLMLACDKGHKEIAQMLLPFMTTESINAVCSTRVTALGFAVMGNHKEIVEILIARGSDINHFELMDALDRGHKEIAMLLAGLPEYDEYPLHRAVIFDDVAGVEGAILSLGIDVNARDNSNCTALHYAVLLRNEIIVRELLDRGADRNAAHFRIGSPLKIARYGGYSGILEIMGEPANATASLPWMATTTYGDTALHLAARNGQEEVVRLLGARADIVLPNGDRQRATMAIGRTPPAAANPLETREERTSGVQAHEGSPAMLPRSPEELLRQTIGSNIERVRVELGVPGIDVNQLDGNGQTALDIANQLVNLLRERRALTGAEVKLLHAAAEGNAEVVKALLREHPEIDVDRKNTDGNTALQRAAFAGHAEAVQLLIRRGANVNIQDANGWSALHWAVEGRNLNIVRMLLEVRGIEVNLGDFRTNQTALDRAIENERAAIENKGAAVANGNTEDLHENVEIARVYGEIIQALRARGAMTAVEVRVRQQAAEERASEIERMLEKE